LNYETHIDKYKDYLLVNNISEGTRTLYSDGVRQFLIYLDKKPETITEDDIFDYIKYTKNKYEQNSLTAKYSGVNHYLKFIKKKDSDGNILKISVPSKVVKNKIPLSKEEIKQLFQASRFNPRDNALLKVLYYAQVRVNEVVNLQVDDIDFEKEKLRINNGKGGYYDTINLHPEALQSIKTYLEFRQPRDKGDKTLFLNKYDRVKLTKCGIHKIIKKYGNQIQLKKRIYPHLFRTSSITHMAEAGLNMAEIQKQSRHKKLETLQSYIQLSDKHVKSAYLKGLTLDEEQATQKPKPEQKPEPKPEPKKPDDETDKYIALLKDGLISVDDFRHIMSTNKRDDNPIYG